MSDTPLQELIGANVPSGTPLNWSKQALQSSVLLIEANSGNVTTLVTALTQTNVTWTRVTGSNTLRSVAQWIGIPTGVPGLTVTPTVTGDAGGNTRYAGQEFSGLDGTSSGSTANGTSVSPLTASVTPTKGRRVLIISNGSIANALSAGPTNSFTPLFSQNLNQAPVAYYVAEADGRSYATGYTMASGTWELCICVYPFSDHPIGILNNPSIPPQFTQVGGLLNRRSFKGNYQKNGGSNYNINLSGSIIASGSLSKSWYRQLVVGIQRVIHPLWNLPTSIFARRTRDWAKSRPPFPSNYSISVGGSITPSGSLSKIYAAGGALMNTIKDFWLKRHWRF